MEKKKANSGAGKLAVILAGVVDIVLIALLVLAFIADPVKSGTAKANLPNDFVENASTYEEPEKIGEYASAAEVVYGASASQQKKPKEEEQGNGADADNPYAGFVFPDSDTVALTDGKIQDTVKDAATCRRAINEIYARHGYAFSKQENIDYFNTYEWYKNMEKETDMAKVSKQFNSVEKGNVEKLQAFENSKNWG
ncbi:MAG: YARHG domain-containing protein [Clostridiales bacterium]|nr:YARHG domain-containing protein [Clostridiales bacterium]